MDGQDLPQDGTDEGNKDEGGYSISDKDESDKDQGGGGIADAPPEDSPKHSPGE